MQRNISALSERLPLCSVPTLKLDRNGEPVLLGRSGKSSHFQLSTNKLISRVHVRAAYVLPTPANAPQVEIKCTGWNGIKVHCKGSAWELGKSETFTSEEEGADIMIDVQDTRVVLQWPRLKKSDTPSDTESDTDGEGSPSRRAACNFIGKVRTHSPVRRAARLQSPLSPIPTARHVSLEAPPEPPLVQIYEDEPEDEELQGAREELEPTQSTIKLTQPVGSQTGLHALQSFKAPNFDSDQDEENDPVIQSFGPAGANLLPRLASFHTGISPDRRTTLGDIKQNSVSPRKRSTDGPKINLPTHPAVNHVVNQLAYSRLASTPLSTILNNLPQEMKVDKTKHGDGIEVDTETLRNLIESTQCIGEIKRAGKDAAGMPLESEYYYVADDDFDEDRRMAIGGLKKPGLRNCRKLHKVCLCVPLGRSHTILTPSSAILLA